LRKEQRDKLASQGKALYDKAASVDSDNRKCAEADLRFAFEDGGQWDQQTLRDRDGRPCFTYNRIEPVIDQIVGDQRQSRPQIKLRAVKEASKRQTDVYSGLIRNIEAMSDSESVYDQQFFYAVAIGSGNWRVINDYCDSDSFDQDIYIRSIPNPFSVVWDPLASHPTKRDANYCFVTSKMSKDAFEAKYPKADMRDFEDLGADWIDDDSIRVAEWYQRLPSKSALLEMSDGRVIREDEVASILDELEAQGITVKQRRVVNGHKIRWVKMTGAHVLEEPIEYKWQWIPVIHVCGKSINIAGREVRKGIVRNAKDPQRSFNYTRSVLAEEILQSPKVDYLLTPTQVNGFAKLWDESNRVKRTWLPYNPDPVAGRPTREPGKQVPIELVTLAQQDADDIKATTGYFDPSLGAHGNETSGKAIIARQQEGDVGSYVYIDNLGKAIRQTGEVLLDMIPDIYDTERQIRILKDDGKEEFVTINQSVKDEQSGESVDVTDRSKAKFEVRVTIGPSYTTLRQEASERLLQVGAAWPTLFQIAPDVVLKGLDIPESGELEARIRKYLITTGAIEPNDEEKAKMKPQQPNPVEELQLQALQLDNEGKQLDNQKKSVEDDKILTEILAAQVTTAEKMKQLGLSPEQVNASRAPNGPTGGLRGNS
jgi:hypothetical protein